MRRRIIDVAGMDIALADFRPCLVYNNGLGILSVYLVDCSKLEVRETGTLDLLYDNHPKAKKGTFAGFNLWRPYNVLGAIGYTKASISLEHLLKRIEKFVWEGPCKTPALGGHKDMLLDIAREHQFVWHIPPQLLLR